MYKIAIENSFDENTVLDKNFKTKEKAFKKICDIVSEELYIHIVENEDENSLTIKTYGKEIEIEYPDDTTQTFFVIDEKDADKFENESEDYDEDEDEDYKDEDEE